MSAQTGVACFHLDETVHAPEPGSLWGNKKRPVEERDALFAAILAKPDFIMEDAGRSCFLEGMRHADIVIWLDPPPLVRRKRFLLRWIRQNLGIERCIYRPCFAVLKSMFKWTRDYETGADGTDARMAAFAQQVNRPTEQSRHVRVAERAYLIPVTM